MFDLLGDSDGVVDYVGHVDGDDEPGAGFRGKHGQDAAAAAHVEHDLVSEDLGVLDHGVHVAFGSDFVLEFRNDLYLKIMIVK
jgi:hypothetical protein